MMHSQLNAQDIALYAAIAALIGFVIMLFATVGDFIADPKIAVHHLANA